MRRASLFLCSAALLAAQTASIEGTAVNPLAGEPLSGVHVRLYDSDNLRAYGAVSGADGRFSISAIEPGSYILSPEYRGYFHLGKAGVRPSIRFERDQHLTGFRLEMTPGVAISGRVLDEYGNPVPYAQVQAEAANGWQPAAYTSSFWLLRKYTDDRGEFRLFVAPGKYRIRALSMGMNNDSEEIRTDGTFAAEPLAYYPNAPTAELAGVLDAAAGRDLRGIEIHLLRGRRGRTHTISGVVSGIPAGVTPWLVLQSGDTAQDMDASTGERVHRDGSFSISHQEGSRFYRATAFCDACRPVLASEPVEFKLEDADVTGLNFTLRPGGDLNGTLEILGEHESTVKRTVRLEPRRDFFEQRSWMTGEVGEGGIFHASGVLPDRYRVHVDPLGENGYIVAVRLDGAPVKDEILDLSHMAHGARVAIAASLKGGQITGRVAADDGQPLTNSSASVYLARDPAEEDPLQAGVTPVGSYVFHAIRPGKYRLIAVDHLRQPGATWKRLFATTEEIEIKEGERLVKDLRIRADEVFHAK